METLKDDTAKAPAAARGPAAVKAVPKDEAPAPHASPWLVIGLMAITFIVFAKMIFAKWNVPGVSEVVSAA
jgi:hypothetical protein